MTNRSGGIVASPICVKGMRQEVLPLDMSNEEVGAKEIDESADHIAEDITNQWLCLTQALRQQKRSQRTT